MGDFVVKAKTRLADLPIGAKISQSDFATLTPDGQFIQLEYIEGETEVRTYDVHPGVWSIQKTMTGMKLEKTSFVNDQILDSFVYTKAITDRIDCFFSKLHVYHKHGFEVPKRALLLYGIPGTGKTTGAVKAAMKYANSEMKDTAVLVWATDKIDPFEVKDFIKSFKYVGVDKLILIMEDVGGVEIDQVRIKSTASLLSLLDNQEKTFTIPIFIIATTNHPEAFLGSLTNRPGRFDDKLEAPYPNAEERTDLLKFFLKGNVPDEVIEELKKKKYNEFSPAHIKEVILRSDIYDMGLMAAIESVLKEIEKYKNMFQEKRSMGIIHDNEPY